MLKISVLGAGGFGCAISSIYDKVGHDVCLWSYSHEEAKEIREASENIHYLPGVHISDSIHITADIEDVFDSDVIFIVVPSFAVRSTLKLIENHIPKSTILVCLSKGFDEVSLELFSDIMKELFPENKRAILSGPSHAEEIAKNITTTLVVASDDDSTSRFLQETFSTQWVRIYINNDMIGVQIGAALKNIIALGIGICDGMGLGDNSKAALMARGLNEIAQIGTAMGAKKETFYGLSGAGDLFVTCTSLHSRNRRAGSFIGSGMSALDAITKVSMTVEGYKCAKAAHELCERYKLDLPIMSEIYNVLYKNKDPHVALKNLLERPYKYE